MTSLPMPPPTAPAVPQEVLRGQDRRRRPTPILSRYWLWGRRRGGRRAEERSRIYVDRYTGSECAWAGGLVLLSGLDLLLTLLHLREGGAEANPVMDSFLTSGGVGGFAVAKVILTALGVLGLLLHVRFPLGRRALKGAVLAYVALMLWHGVVWLDRLA